MKINKNLSTPVRSENTPYQGSTKERSYRYLNGLSIVIVGIGLAALTHLLYNST